MLYIPGMKKDAPFGVRLDPQQRAALERAAAADDRPPASMARKIIVEWLIANGWITSDA